MTDRNDRDGFRTMSAPPTTTDAEADAWLAEGADEQFAATIVHPR